MKWIIIGILLLIGVIITIKDYRNWQHAEWDKFGQGYEDTRSPALELTNLYENEWAGVRLRYPKDWQLTWERVASYPGESIEKETTYERYLETARWGEMMTLRVMKTKKTLPDVVVEEKNSIEMKGRMIRDTEGLQLDTVNEGRILTWEAGEPGKDLIFYKEAVVKRGDRIFKVTCKSNKVEWEKWEKTWLEIFKTMVLFD